MIWPFTAIARWRAAAQTAVEKLDSANCRIIDLERERTAHMASVRIWDARLTEQSLLIDELRAQLHSANRQLAIALDRAPKRNPKTGHFIPKD